MLADGAVGGFARFVGVVIMRQLDERTEQQHRHKRIEPAPPVVGEGWRKALGERIVTAGSAHGAQSKKMRVWVQVIYAMSGDLGLAEALIPRLGSDKFNRAELLQARVGHIAPVVFWQGWYGGRRGQGWMFYR